MQILIHSLDFVIQIFPDWELSCQTADKNKKLLGVSVFAFISLANDFL